MKITDLLKAGLFIMVLVLTVLFAWLISERYKVVYIQKELLQYDRALKIEEWIMNGTNFNISVHRHFIVEIFGLAVYLTAFLLGYLITKLF